MAGKGPNIYAVARLLTDSTPSNQTTCFHPASVIQERSLEPLWPLLSIDDLRNCLTMVRSLDGMHPKAGTALL
jgi:hypothetical protein